MSAGLPWTATEDAVLIEGVRVEQPNKLMARALDRSVDAVVASIAQLRRMKLIPPAVRGRRHARPVTPLASSAPPDIWARADLAQAITTLGRLLPNGMRVSIYHPDGEERAAIETTYPDGETTRHWVDQAMN